MTFSPSASHASMRKRNGSDRLSPSFFAPILFFLPLHRRARRVLRLEPVRRAARAVGRVLPLRHDALEAPLASVGKHGRTVALHVLVEPNAGASHWPRRRQASVPRPL